MLRDTADTALAQSQGNGMARAQKYVRRKVGGGKSPTQRSLAKLRDDGWTCQVVEQWVPGINIRRDLFGFIDILALRGEETLAVQATSRSNISARVSKIAENEHVAAVRRAGWRIEVWGWGKMADGHWQLRIEDIS